MTAGREQGEVPLSGGNTGAGVVRVGSTVRRAPTAASPTVHAFLAHLNDVGYPGAPRTYGFDDRGRHVVEHVEGSVLMPFVQPDREVALRRVGRLLRDLHDAAEGFVAPPDAVWDVVIPPDRTDLVVHHDAAPWNLVTGKRWVLIDWDGCGPGSRLWDLAYAAHGFVPLAPGTTAEEAVSGLRALVDGYGLGERERLELCDLLVPRIRSMYALLRHGHEQQVQPWCRLWDEGHGETWRQDAEHTERQVAVLQRALLDDAPGGRP